MKKTLDLVVKITNWEPDGEDKWKDRMGMWRVMKSTHTVCATQAPSNKKYIGVN